MGLTIHWDLSVPAKTSQRKIMDMLGRFRSACAALGPKECSELIARSGRDECDFEALRGKPDQEDLMWFLLQGTSSARRGGKAVTSIIGFKTWPGDGCEAANFGLAWDGKAWGWHSFCKTQYAGDPECGGEDNFLKCHLLVVAMLDAAKAIGFKVKVHDESGYWESRDLSCLLASEERYNKMMAVMTGAFKDAFGKEVHCAMSGRTDLEKLEHDGQAEFGELARLIAVTAKKATK